MPVVVMRLCLATVDLLEIRAPFLQERGIGGSGTGMTTAHPCDLRRLVPSLGE
jgi:hypothetical protein